MSMRSAASCGQPCAVRVVPRAARTGRGPESSCRHSIGRRRPGEYAGRSWSLEYEIQGTMPGNAPAATRALAALRVLAAAPGPITAQPSARQLGLPRSSTYHLLAAMSDAGFVTHYPEEERWGLGVGAFEIGAAYLRHEPLERWAGRSCTGSPTTSPTSPPAVAHLGVLHGRETLYLLREAPRTPVTVVVDVGVRLPAALTASGRAMLGGAAGGAGARAVPVEGRLRRPDGRGPNLPHRAHPRCWRASARGAGPRRTASSWPGSPRWRPPRSTVRGRPVASIGLTFRSERVDDATRERPGPRRPGARPRAVPTNGGLMSDDPRWPRASAWLSRATRASSPTCRSWACPAPRTSISATGPCDPDRDP